MKINKSIGCEVTECKFHAKEDLFCSLKSINVIRHGASAPTREATDCGSFEVERSE